MENNHPGTTSLEHTSVVDPELAQTLYTLLRSSDLRHRTFGDALEKLERQYSAAVYSALLDLLCHLRFEPDEAKLHWQEIVRHRDSMESSMKSSVDLRVALASYFVHVNRKLESPTIIELDLFEQTQTFAYHDELTGLYNYRFLREYLDREISRGERYGTPVSLIMLDVDDFKTYNDRFGHEAGNEVLATIARLLTESVRELDVAVRYGGEEFTIVLPTTTKTGGQLVAERTRKMIDDHGFPHEDTQPSGKLTASMGLATFPNDATEADTLIGRADRALYTAKDRGKNRVQLYAESRRSYQRIKASLSGRYRVQTADYRPLTTVDISERGFLLRVDRPLPTGSLGEVTLELPESPHEIATLGRVVRVEAEGGGYSTGIAIVDIPSRDLALLTDFIRGQGSLGADAPSQAHRA